MFTVIMTVHDRVKESFEPTVLQKLCVGFLRGFISQACPRQACVLNYMVKLKLDQMLGIRTELFFNFEALKCKFSRNFRQM